ncbi:Ig-like domain-containing protein [Roseovarius atlanticus]|uniref:Ig-like domain-containing protein n=1 Tax=Roseovarius atlanticus TaxID=1641875 RepID=UPI00070C8CD7|nr:Ig-like domain-containing protein [Roseovarius atlanticus]
MAISQATINQLFATDTSAQGNDDPAVSFGLAGITDYSGQVPFLDITKMMRTWIGHEPGRWGGWDESDLEAGGFLDENGWLTAIPDDLDRVGSAWDMSGSMADYVSGTYVLQYEGEGTIIVGGAEIISQENGQITFNFDGGILSIDIMETDPNGNGDYIRDISIVREDQLPLHEAGAIFNPEWLELFADSREFRFMDWMDTNNSDKTSWDEQTPLDNYTWFGDAPVEVMVRLANEAGVDPWFNMPHLADDEYVRRFAEYVRDNLDPELTARVEYSNETWNWAFQQTAWLRDQAAAEWGDTSYLGYQNYHIKRATEVGLIWEDVFAENSDAPQLVNVLGVQGDNPWLADQILSGDGWRANDPAGFVEPSTVFEELAGTTYFGVDVVVDDSLRTQLVNAIQNPGVDATEWLTDYLRDTSIPNVISSLREMESIAEDYGLGLVSYEGGQHVHHSFAVDGLTQQQTQILTEFFTDYVRGPEMAALYQQLWDGWTEVSDGAFMQFVDVSPASQWGSWGLLDSLDDTNPRADYIFDQMQNASNWWGADPNAAYLQGVTETGTSGDDIMVGTDAEDFFAGGAGEDAFMVGDGDDGVNGGDGQDTLLLRGAPENYSITASGEGHVISGANGRKYVINVEEFVFENGDVLSLSQMLSTLPTDPVEPVDPVDPVSPVEPPANNAPTARDDAAAVLEGYSVLINVLADDSDPDGDALVIHSLGSAANGQVVVENGQVRYTPNEGFNGSDTFTYTIADPSGAQSTASVTVGVTAGLAPEEPAPTPVSDVRSYVVGNSLVNHELGQGSDLTSIPYWLARLAQQDGNTYAMAGTYTALRDFQDIGPEANWAFDGVSSAWNDDSGVSFADADFTSVQINPLNYIQWRGPTESYWDGNNTPANATLEIIDYVTAAEPGVEILIYQGWADMGPFVSGSFPPSAQELANYYAYNLGEYDDWYTEYMDALQAARPDVEIRMIPVARVLSTLLTQSPLNQLSATDLYEDDAPHGTPTKYFLASLVTYVDTFGSLPPADFDIPADVHPLVRANYADIVAAIGNEMGVDGGAGTDVLRGDDGNNTLNGNDGNEVLLGEDGNDTLNGNGGDDSLLGGTGFDSILGGDGNDTLLGEGQADFLSGGNGQDYLDGGDGPDQIYGDAGNDTLLGGSGADRLFGGDGHDWIDAGANVGASVDGVEGGAGNDTIFGGVGFDLLRGGTGDDEIHGGAHADNLYGEDGNDTLNGEGGFDRLFGGAGDDLLEDYEGVGSQFGGSGNDTMRGGNDGTTFYGQAGDDLIEAGGGDDRIGANAGFDTINGGAGNDLMFGDFNADTFVFQDGHGVDTVGDFDALNALEKIDLQAVTSIASLADLNLGSATSGAATQAGANVEINTGNGNLIILENVSLSDLDASDFIF